MTEHLEPVRRERDIERVYRSVDDAWGTPNPRKDLPPFPDTMGRRIVKTLFLYIMERPFTGEITVKHRGRSWANSRQIIVNTAKGWWLAVHDLSHQLHRLKYPGERPHHAHHAYLERAMIEEIIRRGWLDEARAISTPKPKPKRDLRADRHARVLARLASWERRRKRAETAIKKLRRQARYYEKARP